MGNFEKRFVTLSEQSQQPFPRQFALSAAGGRVTNLSVGSDGTVGFHTPERFTALFHPALGQTVVG
jgi:hypothetical protein